MEMETRAMEAIAISQDLTPPLPPLSFALHDFLLLSRCSACSAAVSSDSTATASFITYCSAECTAVDSPLHSSSGEHHLLLLLNHRPSSFPHGDSSDLRASLRLLSRLELLNLLPPPPLPNRIAGLTTNRDRLLTPENEDCSARVRDGARAMAVARAMRDRRRFDGDCEIEEAVMCIVLTNAVEVRIGRDSALGIAVYDRRFSWINHSCSPNSCFRFSLGSSSGSANSLIGPAIRGIQIEDDSVYNLYEGCSSKGPRLVVRSIRTMKKGDEVTITYTDLMQPRMLRQSDLWSKHRFLCSCARCSMVSSSYVDHALQETFHADQHLAMINSVDRDGFVEEEMSDYFDSVISDYMSSGDAKSCCNKIEDLLVGKASVVNFRLSPIHHLSLSAYTVLSSAYKVQSSLAENPSTAFSLSRVSTAYSFLLAGATHHLFVSDPSLIASAANFWTNAGESLVSFARSLIWPSSVNRANSFAIAGLACGEGGSCLLLDKFNAGFSCCVAEHEELKKLTQHFHQCITGIARKVWKFLVHDCFYLTQIEDPINFSWIEPLRTSNLWRFPTQSTQERNGARISEYELTNEIRTNVYLLGVHCLIYGCYLSGICYGQDSCADNYDYAREMLSYL